MITKHKPHHQYSTGNQELDGLIKNVLEKAPSSENSDLLGEMMITAIRLAEDGMERGDVRMMNASMKELRYALKVFYPYRHIRKVALFGSARTPKNSADYRLARDYSKHMVKAGWMVITGASTGIMNAGNEGAGRAGSFGVNIRLPFEQEANPIIANDRKLINFKYFFTRKLIFVRESDATVLFPGGFGTHDEGFETLTLVQTGKATPRPIVCLDPPGSHYWDNWYQYLKKDLAGRGMIDEEDLKLLHLTHDPKDAVKVIVDFYKNYHSMRSIGDKLIIRVKHRLEKTQLTEINRRFKNIIKSGKVLQHAEPFREEVNEPHTHHLTRLSMCFNRRHFARLKRLIDFLNTCH